MDDHVVTPMSSMTPENWARVITKRSAMYLGGASFERAIGLLRGLERPLIVKCRTQDYASAMPTSRHHDLLQRDESMDEREAIRGLEPLLVDVFTALGNEL